MAYHFKRSRPQTAGLKLEMIGHFLLEGSESLHSITSHYSNQELVVFIERDIDHHNAANLRREIDSEIARYRPAKVILNFDAVEFMDSSGIGLIMGRYKYMQETGGELKVAALSPRCQKLVDISGITKIVKTV